MCKIRTFVILIKIYQNQTITRMGVVDIVYYRNDNNYYEVVLYCRKSLDLAVLFPSMY